MPAVIIGSSSFNATGSIPQIGDSGASYASTVASMMSLLLNNTFYLNVAQQNLSASLSASLKQVSAMAIDSFGPPVVPWEGNTGFNLGASLTVPVRLWSANIVICADWGNTERPFVYSYDGMAWTPSGHCGGTADLNFRPMFGVDQGQNRIIVRLNTGEMRKTSNLGGVYLTAGTPSGHVNCGNFYPNGNTDNNGLWIVAGTNNIDTGDNSPTSWTNRTVPASLSGKTPRYIAVGPYSALILYEDSEYMAYSADGLTWTAAELPGWAAAFGDGRPIGTNYNVAQGRWCHQDTGGNIWFSTDHGVTWTGPTAPEDSFPNTWGVGWASGSMANQMCSLGPWWVSLGASGVTIDEAVPRRFDGSLASDGGFKSYAAEIVAVNSLYHPVTESNYTSAFRHHNSVVAGKGIQDESDIIPFFRQSGVFNERSYWDFYDWL